MTAEPADTHELGDPMRLVQLNARIEAGLRDAIERRRQLLGISQGEWVRRALEWAIHTDPGTLVNPDPPQLPPGAVRRAAPQPGPSRRRGANSLATGWPTA